MYYMFTNFKYFCVGIICEHGCSEDRLSCTCPKDFHPSKKNGSCIRIKESGERTDTETAPEPETTLEKSVETATKLSGVTKVIESTKKLKEQAKPTTEKIIKNVSNDVDYVCIASVDSLELSVSDNVLTVLCKPFQQLHATYKFLDSIFIEFGPANSVENDSNDKKSQTNRQFYEFSQKAQNHVDVIDKQVSRFFIFSLFAVLKIVTVVEKFKNPVK